MYDITNLVDYNFNNITIGNAEILFCGHQKCVPNHSYGPFVRAHYMMIYVHSGKGVFRNQRATHTLSAGFSFCIFPGEVTYYQADAADPWEYYWIAFNGKINVYSMEHFLLKASISKAYPIHMVRNCEKLGALYCELFQICQNQTSFIDLKIMSLFLDIMYHYIIMTNYYKQQTPNQEQVSNYVDQAVGYIQAHYHENISVSTVAAELGISREYFCILFKKKLNITPSCYIREYRIKSSALLLLSTDYPVMRIADMTGFNEYNYFSNQFKRVYGISPNQYRKKERAEGILQKDPLNP